MRVLVAVPVFNEARYVLGVLSDLKPLGHDILVVDDGSTDETRSLLRRVTGIAVIRHAENRGYGQSLIDAFGYADNHGYDWIITIDCDDQHEPARIPLFVERAHRDDVDIISGSRYLIQLPGSTSAPEDRRRINEKITRLLNRVLGLSLTDGFCGFKAYRVSNVARLPLSIPGYAFPLQFWVQAVHHGLRICELAVPLIYNDPNRHFGGLLDDPDSRLEHYLKVFRAELERVRQDAPACESSARCLIHCE
jgi:glycosyltransferase involved in cell wall biosynthesis